MKELKVEVPGVKTINLSRAEPGIELARPARNRDGQLLIGDGQELTEHDLSRLRKFNVDRIVVNSREERWIEESNRSAYDVQSVLDERTVQSEANRPEEARSLRQLRRWFQARDVELEDNEDTKELIRRLYELEDLREGPIQDLLDGVDSSEIHQLLDNALDPQTSARELLEANVSETTLKNGIDWLNASNDLRNQAIDFREDLDFEQASGALSDDSITGSGEGFSDLFSGLSELINTTGPDQQGVVNQLGDFLGELDEEEDRLEDLLYRSYRDLEDNDVQQTLLEALAGRTDAAQTVLAGRLDTSDLPENMLSNVQSFLEDREHRRERLDDFLDECYDGTSLEDVLDVSDELNYPAPSKTLEQTGDHKTQNNPEASSGFTEELKSVIDRLNVDSTWEGRLRAHLNQVETLDEQRETLRQRIHQLDEPGALLQYLNDAGVDPFPDRSPEDQAAALFNDITKYHRNRDETGKKIKRTFRETGIDLDDGVIPDSLARELRTVRTEPLDIETEIRTNNDNPVEDVTEVRDDVNFQVNKQLEQALQQHEADDVSRLSGVPLQTTESAFELYELPEDISGRRNEVFHLLKEIVFDVLFRARVETQSLNTLLEHLEELLRNHNHPVKLLRHAPAVEARLLVHSFNNAVMVYYIGEKIDLDEDLNHVLLSSVLSDVGLCAVPRSMLNNRSDTTVRAEHEYKKHPLYGEKILERVDGLPNPVLALVSQHHERTDGSGYPRGLQGDDQEPRAGLLQGIDRYNTLIENRVNDPEFKPPAALNQLSKEDHGLDSGVLEILTQTIGYYPDGGVVMLEDGRLGIVQTQNPEAPHNPRIMVITNQDRRRVDSPESMDLSRRTVDVKRYVRR